MQFKRGAEELDKDFLKLGKLIREKQKSEKKHQKTIDKLSNIQNRSQRQESDLIRARNSLAKSSNTLSKLQANSSKLQSSRNLSDRGSGAAGFMGRMSGGLGRRFSGNAGMMMMMGAPMAAGFLQQGGMGAQGGNQSMYAAGGALSGAASGAMMASMIAPMFGPAAPLVIGVGGLIGAVQGMTSANEENTKALKEKREQELKAQIQSTSQAVSQITQGPELSRTLSSAGITEQSIATLGLKEGDTVLQGLQKSKVGHSASQQLVDVIKQYDAGKVETVSPEKLNRVVDSILKNAKIGKEQSKSTESTVGAFFNAPKPQNDMRRYKDITSRKEALEFLSKQAEYNTWGGEGIFGSEKAKAPLNPMGMAALYTKEAQEYMGGTGDPDFPGIKAKMQTELAIGGQARSELIDYLMENEKKKSFAYDFGEEKGGTGYLDKAQYAALLKGQEVKVGGEIGPQKLPEAAIQEALTKESERIQSEYVNAQTEQRDALILQLNFQKAQILAQQASAEAQLDIKSQYLNIANNLSMQEKLMGSFMSDKQKAENKYKLALNKAGEAYESGARGAMEAQKAGILGDINQSSSLKQELKQQLFKEEIEEKGLKVGGEGFTKLDLTDKLAKMDAKDLLKILNEMNVAGDDAKKIIENRNLLYDGAISKLLKQQSLSLTQAANERQINLILSDRKELLDDMNDRVEAFNKRSQFLSEKGALEKRISAAGRTGSGGYISRQQQLEIARSDMEAYDVPALKRAGKGKKLDILKGTGLGFSDGEQAQIMAMRGDVDIASIVKDQKKAEFEKGGGKEKISSLSAILGFNQGLSDEDFKADIGGGKTSRQEMEAELSALKVLDEQRLGINEELNNKILKTNTDLKDQNIINNKNLTAVEKEMKAREDALANMRGEGSFSRGMKYAGDEMRDKVQYMDYELGKNIPMKFADGLAQAMQATLNQTENLGDALMGIASNFLQAIQSALLQKAAYQIVGGVGSSTGLFSKGGGVRNYSRGGGVPAMVTNGEYVMGGDAVSKYGGAFMHSLNAGGKIPGYANGGAAPGSAIAENFGGGRGFASGRAYQSKAMSSFFYTQSQNVGLKEDEQSLMGVLQEEERKRQEAAAKKAKKKAFLQQLLGTALSAGLSYGVGVGAEKGLFGNAAQQRALRPSSSFVGPMMPKYQGGPIRKYANGGHIVGKSGIDQIPAMLSEGEYVIKASSARQLGKPMLDRINAGKYNDGGAVGSTQIDSSTSAGNTNNISISINMENGKVSAEEKTQDANPATSQEGSSEKDQSLLAEKIKQQVVSVIVEEQRPGGLLSE